MRKGAISGAVFNYFRQYPNQSVSVEDVMSATGFARQQVMNSFTSLRSRRVAIVPIISGQVYQYVPGASFEPGTPVPVAATPAEPPVAPQRPVQASPVAQDTRSARRALRVFEEVGELSDGSTVLRSEEGTIYRAMQM